MRIKREKSYADILIDLELSKGALRGPDRGLMAELVYGVSRRRDSLDHIINQFSSQKTDKLEFAVLTLLRLGLYQSHFLDRIPVSAAVNETVNLAKIYSPRATGFINAVLRRADRERDGIVWPDRTTEPGKFMAVYYSHPRWLVEEWMRQIGPEEAELLAKAMAGHAPLTLRANTLEITRDALLERLAEEGIDATKTRYSPEGIHLGSPVNPASLNSFKEGLCTVQDESSQLAALFLSPVPGETILDACAAPGGKTTHIAQIMANKGSVLACDIHLGKLRRIMETTERLGISIIQTLPLDAAKPLQGQDKSQFDRILLDVPCSGLGVIRRNPESKWQKTPDDVARLATLQKTILGNMAGRLRAGGVLLYSTCSTMNAENEKVIDDFLASRNDFVVEDLRQIFPEYAELFSRRGFFRSWPHQHGMDGFFAARLRKKVYKNSEVV
jgi:16S rRNA (cytosine967-C5)-methyltransferase